VVAVGGELDMATAPALGRALSDAIRGADTRVVVDLSGVTFVDSTGLAVLLNAARRATRAGLSLRVACPSGAARHAIAVARLDETLNVRDGIEAAIARGWPPGGADGDRTPAGVACVQAGTLAADDANTVEPRHEPALHRLRAALPARRGD